MSIIKIKNLKYSQSKQQTEAQWAGLEAKRYKLLAESDWTQLQDVNLTEFTRNRWANWRGRLRHLDRGLSDSIEAYQRDLKMIERDLNSLYNEYTELGIKRSLEDGQNFLRKMVLDLYRGRVSATFIPNLEEKYQESLDIISKLYPVIELNDLSSTQVISRMKTMDELELDVRHYPFVEIVMHTMGLTLNQTLVYILEQKQTQYNTALQEEYNMIHFENMIGSCVIPEDLIRTKIEIEMNYGH
jgi:hypothetical protein